MREAPRVPGAKTMRREFTVEIRPLTPTEMRVAISGAQTVPLEQMPVWQAFSEQEGNPAWGSLGWFENDKPVAAIALYEHKMKGLRFLWARRGPVWLKPPAPAREEEAFRLLTAYLRAETRDLIFVRLHSWYRHPELREPFRVIPYDRTVVIDTGRGDADKILEGMPSTGKRLIRRGKAQFEKANATITEETGLSKDQFAEFYQVLAETAERDGFTPHDLDHYWGMLNSLGPEHARLFALRMDGRVVAWDLIGVHGKMATAYYGASTEAARRTQTVALLDFEVARRLGEERITGLDLMGIHSPRVPELYDVGRYKMQFTNEYTDVAGLWDLPIRPALYNAAQAAYTGRGKLRSGFQSVKNKLTKLER